MCTLPVKDSFLGVVSWAVAAPSFSERVAGVLFVGHVNESQILGCGGWGCGLAGRYAWQRQRPQNHPRRRATPKSGMQALHSSQQVVDSWRAVYVHVRRMPVEGARSPD